MLWPLQQPMLMLMLREPILQKPPPARILAPIQREIALCLYRLLIRHQRHPDTACRGGFAASFATFSHHKSSQIIANQHNSFLATSEQPLS
jgi:hypothetical protein